MSILDLFRPNWKSSKPKANDQSNPKTPDKTGWRIGSGVGQKVGVISVIKETQQGIAQHIYNTNTYLTDKGLGTFNLVITPNHDITDFITAELISSGVDPSKIGFHSLNRMHEQLLAALKDPFVKDALNNEVQGDQIKDILKSSDIPSSLSKLSYSEQVSLLLQALKIKVMNGDLRYVVADAFLLGRAWDPGEMNDPSTVEKLRGSDQQKNIKAILWLVNMDRMTENQVREGAARLDPYGDRRFNSSVYDKSMIQITSVMSAKSNRNLQEAANSKGGWSIDLLIEHLPEAAPINE
jgi:hypothetical protein